MSSRTCRHCGGSIVRGLVDTRPDRDWIHTSTGDNVCDLPRSRAEPEPQLAVEDHAGAEHSAFYASGPRYAEEDHAHEDLTGRIRELNMERASLTRRLREHDHDPRYRTHAEALTDLLDHISEHHTPSREERERRKLVKGWAAGLLGGALLGPPIAALVPWDLWVQPPLLWVTLVIIYLWGMLLAAATTVVVTGGEYPSDLGRKFVRKHDLRTDPSGERLLRGDERMRHG